ncbi:MAG: carbohydrate ABC transporter permease [Aquihabitans sp.]
MTTDAQLVGDEGPIFEPPAESKVGRSSARRNLGIAGQYGFLSLLSLLVLLPIAFTLIQALSPPIAYINQGKPLHPVLIDWKNRTWFTGGIVSVVVRTALVAMAFAWLQRVGSGLPSWRRHWAEVASPARLVAIVGGTAAVAITTGPLFQSLHHADGSSAGLWALAVVVVAITQIIGLLDGARRPPAVAVLSGVSISVLVVGAAVVATGAAVWTQAWDSASLGDAMVRSLTMAVLITVSQLVTSILAAYAFVFLEFPFKKILFGLFMATLLLPLEVTLVGNVALIRQLGWINSMQGLVLPFAASAMGTFLIRQGFRGIPVDIQDATRIDGYGHVSFLVKFAVPLARPVIAAFTVIAALSAWNQYLWPRAIIEKSSANTLQIALKSGIAENIAQANVAIAAALVSAVPVGIVLVAFQRHIIRGLTAGAVK